VLKNTEAILERIDWPSEDNKIPRDIYLDEDLYEIEMEQVFGGPHWTLVAHSSEIPEPGDYKTTHLGNVPLIVVRNMEGELNALVNACAHRGTALLRSSRGNVAKRKCLTCIYHNWRYDLDGKLLAATLRQDFPVDFDREQYGLPSARLETYAGAVFVTLHDDTPPLREYLGEIIEGFDLALGDGELQYLGSQRVMFECNWKIAAENLYDGYHTISLHSAFRLLQMRAAGGEQYLPDYERFGHIWNEYRTNAPEDLSFLKDRSVLELRTKEESRNRILNIFPIGVISDQVDTLSLRFAIPRSVDSTEMHFAVFARKGDGSDVVQHRVRQGSNLFGPEGFISLEDQTALARVQDGAPGRGDNVVLKGTLKRFPPYRIIDEAGLRHFYAAYRRSMGF
jgi:phenylpropionate dioxygenase-like ring-hydroxylating dioxygenase large terminal subunit